MSTPDAKSEFSPEVYATYDLLYNNVTYRAVRKAFEEAAAYGQLSDDKSNVEFIDEMMNRLLYGTYDVNCLQYSPHSLTPSPHSGRGNLLPPTEQFLTPLSEFGEGLGVR